MFGGLAPSVRAICGLLVPTKSMVLTPAYGPKPAARFGHTLVLDSVRRRLILFGGQAAGFFNDTWAYDIAANA